MRYIPNTDRDIAEMLPVIGAQSVDDLFQQIPRSHLLNELLRLPAPLSEKDLLDHLAAIGRENANIRDSISFLGGGTYHHFIPSAVSYLASRSEFTTSYTPYQPEISQGTLQAIFEYQSLMCMLTGMDVSNASMYDGASSAAEAVLMALRIQGTLRLPGARRVPEKGKVLLARAVHPDYRAVVRTYCSRHASEIAEVPFDGSGRTNLASLGGLLDAGTACVLIQSPNVFGTIEDLAECGRAIKEAGALFIVLFTEPVAYGLLRPPGEFGADIVCGEGQSLGIPPGFGGPHLGILTARKEHLRNLPGRIVGKGVDKKGRTSFVLTLTAREQHIRREKATSNICTNEGLCALTSSVYLAALGKQGFRELALLNHRRAEHAQKALRRIPGIRLRFTSPVFNEFVAQLPADPGRIVGLLAERPSGRRILAGIPLGTGGMGYEDLGDCLLLTFTDMNGEDEIDELAKALREVLEP